MTRVLVLGASGMLGSGVMRALRDDPAIEAIPTQRGGNSTTRLTFDATRQRPEDLLAATEPDFIINAIGVIRQKMDTSPASIRGAVAVNTLFPLALSEAAERAGVGLIQIATDCVFSGRTGPSCESSIHDPTDPYGMTKSLGEARGSTTLLLRTSIVGPETGPPSSLLGWFLSQPRLASVPGFTNHLWSGITTDHFGLLCRGLVKKGALKPGLLHLVPGDYVSEAELLEVFAGAYGREDITIRPEEATCAINRRLCTEEPEWNADIWRAAGYAEPPSIRCLINEQVAMACEPEDQ